MVARCKRTGVTFRQGVDILRSADAPAPFDRVVIANAFEAALLETAP
jgi:hypothetical protein